jgi:hypothetical protein
MAPFMPFFETDTWRVKEKSKYEPKSTGKELMKSITYGIPKFRVFPTPVNSGLWRGASGPAVGLTYPSLHLMGERPRLKGR